MAKSGSITTNESHGRSVKLSWSLSSQSVENNQSTLSWSITGAGSASGWVMTGGFKAVINGTTVYSTSTDTRIQLYNGTSVASGTTKITHNADGTKSFSLSIEAGVYTYAVSVTASGTHTLDTIPRASTVSATNTNLNSASTITITRASSSFTHTLTYSFGSTTGTIVSKTTSTSVSWTPALTLANQIPNAVSGTCTITCDTYNGSTKIGSKTCTLTLTVPASVKPTMTSVTATRVDGDVPAAWAIYVQNKSKATVTINGAAGAYGSTISSYSISGGGYSSTASSFTTGLLAASGTITFTAKVTDSRGRVSDAKTVSISVVAYSAPSFSSYISQRATSAGVINDDGTYIRGLISFSYATCSSKNTITCATYYKKSSATSWTNANKSFSSGTAFTFGGGAISTESSYDVKYTITDAFTTITIIDMVSTASVLMDFKAGGKGIAIGKVSEKDKTLEIADSWELEVHGKKLIDYIYPIGSIYLSVNSTSPATLFGGSWTQLKDRFLLGAGSTYSSGATGGAATHKLSVAEMPSHAHDTPFFNNMTNNGE
ncbi:pilus assembly protein [Enterococcus faecalis]|nr:pilus assembly protein [Enterococcus faecalis]